MAVDILLTYYVISNERTLNGEIDRARIFFFLHNSTGKFHLFEGDFELNMVLFAENTSIGGYDAMCVAALLFAQGSQPVFFSVYLCVLGLHQRRALAPPPQDCSSVKIINKNGVML